MRGGPFRALTRLVINLIKLLEQQPQSSHSAWVIEDVILVSN